MVKQNIAPPEGAPMTGLPAHRPPTHPGETLMEECLKPLDISQSEFTGRPGVLFPRKAIGQLMERSLKNEEGFPFPVSRSPFRLEPNACNRWWMLVPTRLSNVAGIYFRVSGKE
jgi:hypothetical protein